MLFGLIDTKRDKLFKEMREELDELVEAAADEPWRFRDRGWAVVSGDNNTTDFTVDNHQKMITKAREAFFFSPAGKRIVAYITSYVMGKGFKIKSSNEAVDYIIDEFMNNPNNQMLIQLKEWSNRLQTDGEVFPVFHLQYDGTQIVREINPIEIEEILTDPDDIKKPILFKRIFEKISYYEGKKHVTQATEYIPYLFATLDDILKLNMGSQAGLIVENRRIYHCKTITFSDRKRGLSTFSAILQYLSRLKTTMDSKLKINKIKEAFYLDVTVDGGPAAVTAEAAKTQYKKPPKAASAFFHNKKVEIDLKQPNLNYSDENKIYDPILRQITMGSGMPEWMILGMANMFKAGAKEQSGPFTKIIEDMQELWMTHLLNMMIYIIKEKLNKNNDRNFLANTDGIKGLLSEIDENYMIDKLELNEKGKMVKNGKKIPFWRTITIEFPEIITRDEKNESDAITSDLGNGLISKNTASTRRGYNYEKEKILIGLEKEEEVKRDPLANQLLSDEHDEMEDEDDKTEEDEE